MNNRMVSARNSVLNRLLRSVVSVHVSGVRIFLPRQDRRVQLYFNRAESVLVQRQMELIKELTVAVRNQGRGRVEIGAVLAEFLEVTEERERLKMIDLGI